MKKYIITRLLNFVPLMVAITFLSFLIIEMAPGDYFSQLQMNPQISRETLDEMRTVMRERRIRHIPVVDGERVTGIISIGDLNKAEHEVQVDTIRYLQQYMSVT